MSLLDRVHIKAKKLNKVIKTDRSMMPKATPAVEVGGGALDDDDDDDDDGWSRKGRSKPSGSSRRKKIAYGFHLVEGKQGHAMEDYHVAELRRIDRHNEVGLFAIFDGHSGHDVASYLRNHLFDSILDQPDFWTDAMSAIRRAYHRTDRKILKIKEHEAARRGGSTAVTVIVVNGEKLVVANVGDSRAVICEGDGVARQLSVDHEPIKERHAIESRGGFVTHQRGNVPRVEGQLAMSRAFGDRTLKEHISSDPDVVIEDINEDVRFVILASDGLWKVMGNEEMVRAIEDAEDAQKAAAELIPEAVGRGSTDVISCIVVRFF